MIDRSVVAAVGKTPLVALERLFPPSDGVAVLAKLELLNPGGSIKDRPARFFVEKGLREGWLAPGAHLIESSSGNFGISVAMAARVHGLAFTCVVDPRTTPTNLKVLARLGATVDMVSEADGQGGYLHTRIRRVRALLDRIPGSVWINQYANACNWLSHYYGTAAEILHQLDRPVDALVVPGTILGLGRRLRCVFPAIRVIAVDAVGSVIFGDRPAVRRIPGLGASRVPELFSASEVDDVVHVRDADAALGCRDLVSHEGILAGGSSGAVVSAISRLIPRLPRPYRILTVLPDRGERYLETVYDDAWAATLDRTHEGDPVVLDDEPLTAGRP
jgi:cysteine synthase A